MGTFNFYVNNMDRAFVWIIPRFTPGRQEAFYSQAGYKTDSIFFSTSRISCLTRTLRDKFPTRDAIYRNLMRDAKCVGIYTNVGYAIRN